MSDSSMKSASVTGPDWATTNVGATSSAVLPATPIRTFRLVNISAPLHRVIAKDACRATCGGHPDRTGHYARPVQWSTPDTADFVSSHRAFASMLARNRD